MAGNDTHYQEASLHDWLQLGEIELALSPETQKENDEKCRRRDQVHRLPLLLRLLAGSQPLSSVPSILGDEHKSDEVPSDPLIDGAVSRLENVAATYSAAEGVDALVSNLAPTISRKIGKLQPLKRKYSGVASMPQRRKWEGVWETRELALVAASPVGGPRKKRRLSEHVSTSHIDSDDEIEAEEDDEMLVDNEEDERDRSSKTTVTSSATKEEEGPKDSQSFLVGAAVEAEDTQESMVVKTLSEMASIVVASLEPIAPSKEDSDDKTHGNIALSVMSDSLLSEPGPATDAMDSVGAIGGSDLGATVVALMHHAPVLRHRHVANALCRMATPQAADLIARMAANCPATSPCLVQGCIDAYRSANMASGSPPRGSNAAISASATASVRAIAKLSPREAGRVLALLQKSRGAMVGLTLELCIPDPNAAASFIVQQISTTTNETLQPASNSVPEVSRHPSRRRIRSSSLFPGTQGNLSLRQILQDSPSLALKLCESLLEELTALRSGGGVLSWGRTALVLRAHSLLLLQLGAHDAQTPSSKWSRSDSLEAFVSELVLLGDKVCALIEKNDVTPPTSNLDRCFQMLLCSCLVVFARLAPSAKDEAGAADISDTCKTLLQRLLSTSFSLKSDVFASRVAIFLGNREVAKLHSLICDNLDAASTTSGVRRAMDEQLEAGFGGICQFADEKLNLQYVSRRGVSESAVLEDPTALVEAIESGKVQVSQLSEILRSIYSDPVKCKALVKAEEVRYIIEQSVALLSKQTGPRLPILLPIDIESLARDVEWPRNYKIASMGTLGYQFLLHMVYCLCFLEQEPESPFVIDPRNLPLKEALLAYNLISSSGNGTVAKSFGSLLEELMSKHCGEVVSHGEIVPEPRDFSPGGMWNEHGNSNCRKISNMVSAAIRTCLENEGVDSSGATAERSFLLAKAQLLSTEVDVTVVGALLSTRNSPPPFFTHAMLCRDPLVLLKCPLAVWGCRGLRRIALGILGQLMESNEHIVKQLSPTEEAASELLVTRDTLVVRCLVIAASGGSAENASNGLRPYYCSMTLAMIRMLVARQRGIFAMLVKQGIPDSAVDWIIEFIPESINDAGTLRLLLSERSSLTAAERLKTADAALRVAIAHGSRDSAGAQTLVYTALSVMVSSFFLVIGPVGVPVNVLCEEGGLDVTQVCRKAMFRMLSALQKVNGRKPGIRNECAMALQKIAGLCKGESIMSGVAGVVAARRKNLLKEIWDAVVKASNAMGGGIQI